MEKCVMTYRMNRPVTSLVTSATATLMLAITASTAQAGIFDNINKVINTVDRANNTLDRAEQSAKRTANRLGVKQQPQNQGQVGTQGYPNQGTPTQNMPTMGGFNNNMAYPTGETGYVAGTWKFDWGNLNLQQNGNQVSGTYTEDAGQVGGTMTGNVLSGYWSENTSDKRCATPLNGRYHWGRMQLQFTNSEFVGQWGYCNDPMNSQLKGTAVQFTQKSVNNTFQGGTTTGVPSSSGAVVFTPAKPQIKYDNVTIFESKADIYLNKYNFHPSEMVVLTYTAPSSASYDAWIGIVPANIQHGNELISDQHDISRYQLKNRTSGTIKFQTPSTPGMYDFRMYDNDNGGAELFSISFNVR